MLIFVGFFLFHAKSELPVLYIGNITYGDMTNVAFNIRFLTKDEIKYNITSNKCKIIQSFIFLKGQDYKQSTYPLIGFRNNNDNNSFVFFHKQLANDNSFIADQFCNEFSNLEFNFSNLKEEISQIVEGNKILYNYLDISINPFPSIILFKEEEREPLSPYHYNIGINGSILLRKKNESIEFKELFISGFKFNYYDYIVNAKVFGVITSIFLILDFYGWKSLSDTVTITSLSQLSMESFIMHMGFEFSYAMYLFDYCLKSSHLRNQYFVLTTVCLIVYLLYQMSIITRIWRTSFDLDNINIEEFRVLFFKYLTKIFIILCVIMIIFSFTFEFPIFTLLLLYSFYIPQIYHSAKGNFKNFMNLKFLFTTTLYRIHILVYFFLYHKNIEGSFSKFSIVALIYLLLQNIIILLQNKFGGGFFLPKKYKPQNFDYFANSNIIEPNTECAICMLNIEEGEVPMVTPCHHAFHQNCLKRWMEVQMICPICRAQLPQYEGD